MRRVSNHQHVQTIPSNFWSIPHGLYCKPIVGVKVYHQGELVEVLPVKIAYPSDSLVEITFSSLRTGEARLS